MPSKYFSGRIREQGRTSYKKPQSCSGRTKLRKPIFLSELWFGGSGGALKYNSFLLSLVSPVLRKMICGDYAESASKEIVLDDIQQKHFKTLLCLACGSDEQQIQSIQDLFEIGGRAKRLGMAEVVEVIEHMLASRVSAESCSEMLGYSNANGLQRVQNQCEIILRNCFQEVSRTQGFLGLSEETLSVLLEDDELGVIREEDAYEAVIMWMSAKGEQNVAGEKLLTKIRYGVMAHDYLARIASTERPAQGLLIHLVEETMKKKGIEGTGATWDGVERLSDKWMVARKATIPVANLPAGTILGADVLLKPRHVALDREGRVIVTDVALNQIIMFNRDGSVARRFGSHGTAPGSFDQPMGVAVDRHGRVIIADSGNHRVQVLSADWSVERCFGSKGTAAGQFQHPHGVAVDREGRIVVSDLHNYRVQVFDPDGSFVRQFGWKGTAAGQLDCPQGVAVDGAGRIVVADQDNDRVQVFSEDGSRAWCFGTLDRAACFAALPGQVWRPEGVAVDKEGRFVVADCNNFRVQVFNSNGTFAHIIGGRGTGEKELDYPVGVVVDGAGRILVVEGGIRRCQVRVF